MSRKNMGGYCRKANGPHSKNNRQIVDVPKCNDLELRIMNAGEGAFHWVRLPNPNEHGGWFFDCGTKCGKALIDRSIAAVKKEIADRSANLIVSHFHKDHTSRIRSLDFAIDRNSTICVPNIDQFSMELYLRIISFGTMFLHGRTVLHDKDLSKLFSKKDGLVGDLRKRFPGAEILRVSRGKEFPFPEHGSGMRVEILSPPEFNIPHHPLRGPTGIIRAILRKNELRESLIQVAQNLLNSARDRGGFRRFLDEQFSGDVPGLDQEFGRKLIGIYMNPDERRPAQDTDLLRLFLAAASEIPASSSIRLSLSDPLLSPGVRSALRDWEKQIREATHLFNIAASFSDQQGRSFLLTGDADARLWPCMIAPRGQYSAVQVPHHGSRENVDYDSYAHLDSDVFVVSAGKYRSWRHPSWLLGTAIRESVSSRNRRLYCTNAHSNCELFSPNRQCGVLDSLGLVVTAAGVKHIINESGDLLDAAPCPHV